MCTMLRACSCSLIQYDSKRAGLAMQLKPAKSGQSQQAGSMTKRSCNAWLGSTHMAYHSI